MSNSTNTTLNAIEGSINFLSGEVEYLHYGYNVSKVSALIFTVLFGLSTIVHFYQAIRIRYWSLTWTLGLGAFIETVGWAARALSAFSTKWDPTEGGFWSSDGNAFLAQITTLIIAPAFLMAANYIILARLINTLGPSFCRLTAKTYTIIFVTGDFLSLCIQGAGGGLASTADTHDGAENGARIMVYGVIWQMVVMIAFTLLFADFVYHYLTDRPVSQIHPFAWTRKARAAARESKSNPHVPMLSLAAEAGARKIIWALSVGTGLIFVRSVYRTIELLNGWSGPIITNQLLFDLLDGAMIVITVILLNVLHPMFYLRNDAASGASVPLPTMVNDSEVELAGQRPRFESMLEGSGTGEGMGQGERNDAGFSHRG